MIKFLFLDCIDKDIHHETGTVVITCAVPGDAGHTGVSRGLGDRQENEYPQPVKTKEQVS